jgi:hypothetical protein
LTKIKKKFLEEPEEPLQKVEEGEKPQEKSRRRKYKRKKFLIPKEEKGKKPLTNEERLYYYKMFLGFASGLVGRLIGLYGLWLLLWLVIFWFGAPFILGLLIAPYQKEKWDWKMFLKTAVAAFFFVFMVTTTIIHTLIVTSPGYVPPWV